MTHSTKWSLTNCVCCWRHQSEIKNSNNFADQLSLVDIHAADIILDISQCRFAAVVWVASTKDLKVELQLTGIKVVTVKRNYCLIALSSLLKNTVIPTEVKATPIMLLKPHRQLLALCTSQSFYTRVYNWTKTLTYELSVYKCWNSAHNYAKANKLTLHYLLCCEISNTVNVLLRKKKK